jgi:L-ascorbate metabolism protein UlaG (beta-lactamase superfamily)
MQIRWYGQSAFLLSGTHRVFIDPFGDLTANDTWDYPPIEGVDADLLLVTHDHRDHNAVDVIGGDPPVLRTAGTHESPIGEVVGINSEHDEVAGTQRGQNTIFRFTVDGVTVAHFGDFGQRALRPEQRDALGGVDVLILPVGGGPTIPQDDAAALVRDLAPRIVVPMHYRTPQIGFLDPPDAFLDALGWPVDEVGAETELSPGDEQKVVKLTLT